jgi:hypothetical protein
MDPAAGGGAQFPLALSGKELAELRLRLRSSR